MAGKLGFPRDFGAFWCLVSYWNSGLLPVDKAKIPQKVAGISSKLPEIWAFTGKLRFFVF